MNKQIEAMKLALEALEMYLNMDTMDESYLLEIDFAPKAIIALQEALAEQPAQQEPVFSFQMELHAPAGALIHPYPHVVGTPDFKSLFGKVGDRVTFYTTPPQRKPLTDEEIEAMANDFEEGYVFLYRSFARAIEAAHGITKGNT